VLRPAVGTGDPGQIALDQAALAGGETPHDGRPRRALAALALGLAAIATVVGSGADFSARTANPGNTFSAGALSMENSKDGTAIFSATNMKPGGAPQTGIVDIKNTGSIEGVFSLSRDQLTNTDGNGDNPAPFASRVALGIVDCGRFTIANTPYGTEQVTPTCGDADDTTLYLGSLANENSATALGTYQPGEQRRYRFEGSLASSAGNEYQGDGASARYVFDAVQTP
jgi:spore coat-associated protein N